MFRSWSNRADERGCVAVLIVAKGGINSLIPASRLRQPQHRARKKKERVLSIGRGCLASVSEYNSRQLGARAGIFRGRV